MANPITAPFGSRPSRAKGNSTPTTAPSVTGLPALYHLGPKGAVVEAAPCHSTPTPSSSTSSPTDITTSTLYQASKTWVIDTD
ncbi:hypothetical protein CONLIGDRAFT_107800 [Coniochaeta ligniaria NRRL 30616]|uniref:Uncharacterized protein n=1 Tax=Coniochaeta ligniaria NRRL 30616 TaxID=1408157 RepID=A0A1J7ISZ6_9PEZI|nr:hypothetical protein CONLIGDRAFT_107800 [Coniochaeta ligniaria NRRL 30616]